jgi:hypothetical protein
VGDDERATPGQISEGRTAIHSLKLLAAIARDAGFSNRKNESNAEMIGRALRELQFYKSTMCVETTV